MCRNVLAWAEDPDVGGSHSLKPVLCDEYILGLETALYNASFLLLDSRTGAEVPSIADSELVRIVRKNLGITSLPHDHKIEQGRCKPDE